jgi:hypothetical protein
LSAGRGRGRAELGHHLRTTREVFARRYAYVPEKFADFKM